MGLFFSLFLFANNFNLSRTSSYYDEHNLSYATTNIENAYALEIDNINNSKIVSDNGTIENNKNMALNSNTEIGLEIENNKEIQGQKRTENNLDVKNTTLQNTGLLLPTQSANSIEEGFNFAATGDWACTSKQRIL